MTVSKTKPHYQPDRRLSARYQVHGSLVLDTAEKRYDAVLVDLSFGGILFQAKHLPPVDTQGTLQLHVDGYGEPIVASVRVVRSNQALAAAIFVIPPPSLIGCIEWLGSKNREP